MFNPEKMPTPSPEDRETIKSPEINTEHEAKIISDLASGNFPGEKGSRERVDVFKRLYDQLSEDRKAEIGLYDWITYLERKAEKK